VNGRLRSWRTPLAVLIVSLFSGAVLKSVDNYTSARAGLAAEQHLLRDLRQVLPPDYDNDVLKEAVQFTDPDYFGGTEPLTIYPARKGKALIGAALAIITTPGYNAPLRLMIGVEADGRLRAVRVLEQHETPGLGANVDPRHSGWLSQFGGRSLGNPPAERWSVKQDGGDFDALSGATITSRVTTNALHQALALYAAHHDEITAAR